MTMNTSPAATSTGRTFRAPARRIIDAGERLIGELGIEGASLLQVAAAAGLTGKYAVQYHFGSREGLITAILECRLPEVNEIRRPYIAHMHAERRYDVRSILHTLFAPMFDHVNAHGQRMFAKFAARIGPEYYDQLPDVAGREPYAMLQEALPHLSKQEFLLRFAMVKAMYNIAVWQIDEEGDEHKPRIFASFLTMAEQGLMAPATALDSAGQPIAP